MMRFLAAVPQFVSEIGALLRQRHGLPEGAASLSPVDALRYE